MFCLVCLFWTIPFGILALLFPKYRNDFKDSVKCFWNKMTLSPCDVNFDEKMRAKIVAWIGKYNQPAARFVYKHYDGIFTFMMLLTIAYSIWLVYVWMFPACGPADACSI